eukprot:scaffold7240_cov38-Prasinocladus_malaysianus.AAC.1
MAPVRQSDPTLPAPWQLLLDPPSGLQYYWNPETNHTQYERPDGGAPAPALAPAPANDRYDQRASPIHSRPLSLLGSLRISWMRYISVGARIACSLAFQGCDTQATAHEIPWKYSGDRMGKSSWCLSTMSWLCVAWLYAAKLLLVEALSAGIDIVHQLQQLCAPVGCRCALDEGR